jgi:hypothetical protein
MQEQSRAYPLNVLVHSESRDLSRQVVLLWKARRTTSRGAVVIQRLFSVTGHLEKMGADRVEPVVTGQPVGDLTIRANPADGPRTIAAATARLSVTTGLPRG